MMVTMSAVMVAARIAKWKLDTAAAHQAQTLALSCAGMGRGIVQSNVMMGTQQMTMDAPRGVAGSRVTCALLQLVREPTDAPFPRGVVTDPKQQAKNVTTGTAIQEMAATVSAGLKNSGAARQTRPVVAIRVAMG
jgi:ABC-type arginine transport system ATPase subunit